MGRPAKSAKPAKTRSSKAKPKAEKAKPKAKLKAKLKAKPKAKAKARPRSSPAKARRPVADRAEHAERFDRGPYDLPVMDLGEAIALATALAAAEPARLTPVIAEEASRVAAACARAKTVHATDTGQAPSIDARPYDVAMDRAWATFVRRIEDHAELPAARHADAVEASKVYVIVRDLSILKLNYLAEFAQIGARVDSLKREGLLDAARTFAGAAFVDEVFHCLGEYGEALGVTSAPEAAQSPLDRGEARLALVEAIGEYAFQVLAQARAGRPESWAPVHQALRPIADLRARQAEALRPEPPRHVREPHPPVDGAGHAT